MLPLTLQKFGQPGFFAADGLSWINHAGGGLFWRSLGMTQSWRRDVMFSNNIAYTWNLSSSAPDMSIHEHLWPWFRCFSKRNMSFSFWVRFVVFESVLPMVWFVPFCVFFLPGVFISFASKHPGLFSKVANQTGPERRAYFDILRYCKRSRESCFCGCCWSVLCFLCCNVVFACFSMSHLPELKKKLLVLISFPRFQGKERRHVSIISIWFIVFDHCFGPFGLQWFRPSTMTEPHLPGIPDKCLAYGSEKVKRCKKCWSSRWRVAYGPMWSVQRVLRHGDVEYEQLPEGTQERECNAWHVSNRSNVVVRSRWR